MLSAHSVGFRMLASHYCSLAAAENSMKRAAQHPPSVRRKVQHVSCPCCEARLALHFVHGEDEVYDVELLGLSPAPEQIKGGSRYSKVSSVYYLKAL